MQNEFCLVSLMDDPLAHEAPDHYAGNGGKKKECGGSVSH